jgi:hypothetical protein
VALSESLIKSLSNHWWQLLALALNAVVLAAAFWVGFDLGQTRGGALAVAPIPTTMTPEQCDGRKDEISALRQQGAVLERTRQIEQETNRSLQDQLKQVQGERLALVKEASYLKRLIQDGGRGVVRVQDLRLSAGEGPRAVRYAFTLTQLIPGFGESQGLVKLAVTGTQKDQARAFDLEQLPGAEPTRLSMRFEHFQSFQGEFSLPEGFIPKTVEVTLVPEGDQLTATSESFTWVLVAP